MDLYHLFADLIDYPRPMLSHQVNECVALLSPVNQKAVTYLKPFQSLLEKIPIRQMEEIYTRAFDLQASCCPYVGYHLFGDGNRRGIFMARLKEHYRTFGFSCGDELPDHLGVMLRFLSSGGHGEEEEFITLCVIPAVQSMIEGLERTSNPYLGVLQALWLVLQNTQKCGFQTEMNDDSRQTGEMYHG
jgi:nitrate reductase delta subunit